MSAPRDSLTDRLARRAARAARTWPELAVPDMRLALALAGLVALGPLLTIMGAQLLHGSVEADNRSLANQLRARDAPQAKQAAAAAELRNATRQAPFAATLDRIARALPDDARLVSAARGADGRMLIEISASDPDLLRGALRRNVLLASLRESGQRRTQDARVVVTLRTPV